MTGQDAISTSGSGADTTEASPLLRGHVDHSAADQYRRRVIVVTFAMFFVLEFGAGLLLPGSTAALEQKICDEKYNSIAPANRDCKSPDVQGQLAALKGWQTMLDCVPGTLLYYEIFRS